MNNDTMQKFLDSTVSSEDGVRLLGQADLLMCQLAAIVMVTSILVGNVPEVEKLVSDAVAWSNDVRVTLGMETVK